MHLHRVYGVFDSTSSSSFIVTAITFSFDISFNLIQMVSAFIYTDTWCQWFAITWAECDVDIIPSLCPSEMAMVCVGVVCVWFNWFGLNCGVFSFVFRFDQFLTWYPKNFAIWFIWYCLMNNNSNSNNNNKSISNSNNIKIKS